MIHTYYLDKKDLLPVISQNDFVLVFVVFLVSFWFALYFISFLIIEKNKVLQAATFITTVNNIITCIIYTLKTTQQTFSMLPLSFSFFIGLPLA